MSRGRERAMERGRHRVAVALALVVPALFGRAPASAQGSGGVQEPDRVVAPRAGEPTSRAPSASRGSAAPVARWHEIVRWSAAESRAAFAACDPDADDRLSILEAARALEPTASGGEGTAPAGGDAGDAAHLRAHVDLFRRLDRDRDGYLSWPEFDARCRDQLLRHGAFRVRIVRPLVSFGLGSGVETASSAESAVLQAIDRDGDGAVSLPEFQHLLATAGLPPALAVHFPTLDSDGSGGLSGDELGPLSRVLPQLAAQVGDPETLLPFEWRAADTNHDGVLDRVELEATLRAAGPALARWTDTILRRADRSGNATLGAPELRAALAQPTRDRRQRTEAGEGGSGR